MIMQPYGVGGFTELAWSSLPVVFLMFLSFSLSFTLFFFFLPGAGQTCLRGLWVTMIDSQMQAEVEAALKRQWAFIL